MHPFLGFTLESLVIIALVAANGFFVAAEFALVKVRASQLRPLARQGGWRVKLALRATEHLDAALSATQLGITLASLGLGWIGEPFLAHRLEPLLARFGITDSTTVQSTAFAVAFAAITFLHIVFGELAPKSLAIQRAKGVTLWVAAPLLAFYYLFFPFIWVLNGTANRFLRWAGLGPTGEGEHGFSADELEYVFSHARHTHPSDTVVNRLMVQSLRVRSTTAIQIMLPRDQVTVLRLDAPLAETLRTAQTSGHSRFPIVTGDNDEVKGVLLIREWLWQLQALGPDAPFAPLLRPVFTFSLKATLPEMIERFRQSRTHLAVVLDEQSRFAGIVTLEDVLEEIVGDIRDETDLGRGPIYEHNDRAVVASGALTMRELQAETGWSFEWLPRETVAAWFLRHTGRAPRLHETVALADYRLTALEIQGDRLRRIRIERPPETTSS